MTSGGGGGGGVRGFARRVEGSGQGGDGKSEKEKEKTKLRERRRRSITGKILEGLRKHGGYELPPRADINDVLRALAREAGWVVEPDGTTYRAKPAVSCQVSSANSLQQSSACVLGVTGRSSTPTPTPTSSLGAGGGGHSSATASPLRQPPAGVGHSESASHLVFSGTGAHLPGLGSGLQGGTLASAIHWIHSRMTYDG